MASLARNVCYHLQILLKQGKAVNKQPEYINHNRRPIFAGP